MDAIEAILNRHSYRGRYRPEPVPREDLTTILRAGLAAPSGCNKQTVSLIAVDDPNLLARLHAVIDPPVGETAPAMICENMLLAIIALGYQSCWYEGHITDEDCIGRKMADILGVPEEYELVCFLPVGIGVSKPIPPKKKPMDQRAWFNGFSLEN